MINRATSSLSRRDTALRLELSTTATAGTPSSTNLSVRRRRGQAADPATAQRSMYEPIHLIGVEFSRKTRNVPRSLRSAPSSPLLAGFAADVDAVFDAPESGA